jgi:hypothetical protein
MSFIYSPAMVSLHIEFFKWNAKKFKVPLVSFLGVLIPEEFNG